jgi:ferredoxin
MRILVDRGRCEGNGRCAALAPAVFVVDAEDQVQLLIEQPPPELHAAVEAAVMRCPRQALSIDDE